MKVNWMTLLMSLLVAVLGVLNAGLTNGAIQLPPADQWLVPVASALVVMVTKHITDTTPAPRG